MMVKTGALGRNWGLVGARVGLGHDEAASILTWKGVFLLGWGRRVQEAPLNPQGSLPLGLADHIAAAIYGMPRGIQAYGG